MNAAPGLATPALQSFEELEIPAPFRAAVENELTADEQIVWLGRPSRNRLVHPPRTAFAVGGIALIGLGVLMLAWAILSHGAGPFPFVFAVFLGLFGGIFLFASRVDPTRTCNACYVVTNRRALVFQVSLLERAPRARSYLPHQLLGLERKNHPEVAGAGDLIFEYTFALPGNSFDPQTGTMHQGLRVGWSNKAQRVPRGFFLLDQVREVENLIRGTLLGELEKTLDEREARPGEDVAAGSRPQDDGTVADAWQCREDGEVPADLKAKALADLDPKEWVVWIGQPVGKIVFVRSSAYLVVGGIIALVALLWLAGTLLPQKAASRQAGKAAATPRNEQPSSPLLPGGLLLASVGLAAVPLVRQWSARRTCYALTNRRALVYKEGLFGPTRESYPPLEVAAMRRANSWLFADSGDLIFRSVTVITTSRGPQGGASRSVKTTHYGFLAIAHAKDVERLVRETLIDRFADKLSRASSL
jgi:hypothetical protein